MNASLINPNVSKGVLTGSKPHRRQHRCHRPGVYASSSSIADTIKDKFVVIGGGPAGLATALSLQRIGIPTVVLERDSQDTATTGGTALGLWTNAWRALDALGAADSLRKQHMAIDKVELCRDTGKSLRSFRLSTIDGGPHEFRGVARSSLVSALSDQLEPGTVMYNIGVDDVLSASSSSSTSSGCRLQLSSPSSGQQEVDCRVAIGADGVRGATLTAAQRRPARFVGQLAIRGVAHFPQGLPSTATDCIRQLWSVGPRAGMYPLSDTELYWFVCFDATADNSGVVTDRQAIKNEAAAIVEGWKWGIKEAVAQTPLEKLSRSRLADRWDLPSTSGNNSSNDIVLTLAGDALHPMTPNLGQGGCTSLEDAVVLGRLLKQAGVPDMIQRNSGGLDGGKTKATIQRVFKEYEEERMKRCLPITVRSFAMGAALQLPIAPVAFVRDAVVSTVFNPDHFLDHAAYDCGILQ